MTSLPDPTDLSTLADVKTWLNITDTSSDAKLQSLLTRASARFVTLCKKNGFIYLPYSELRNGNGRQFMLLRNTPVRAFTSVAINTTAVAASPDNYHSGYTFNETGLMLIGSLAPTPAYGLSLPTLQYTFGKGYNNVSLSYFAGYGGTITDTLTVSAGSVTPTLGSAWTADNGVVYQSSKTPLVKVPSGPTAGEYAVNLIYDPSNPGYPLVQYAFNPADNGQSLLVSYAFKSTPADVQQAVIEMCGMVWRRRDHIDQNSMSMGQQVISFSKRSFPETVQEVVDFYTFRFTGE